MQCPRCMGEQFTRAGRDRQQRHPTPAASVNDTYKMRLAMAVLQTMCDNLGFRLLGKGGWSGSREGWEHAGVERLASTASGQADGAHPQSRLLNCGRAAGGRVLRYGIPLGTL